MKDKIKNIIESSDFHIDGASDAICELMCYREVRAFCKGRSQCLNVPNFLVAIFKDSYPKEDILKAIEQVKNEMS